MLCMSHTIRLQLDLNRYNVIVRELDYIDYVVRQLTIVLILVVMPVVLYYHSSLENLLVRYC